MCSSPRLREGGQLGWHGLSRTSAGTWPSPNPDTGHLPSQQSGSHLPHRQAPAPADSPRPSLFPPLAHTTEPQGPVRPMEVGEDSLPGAHPAAVGSLCHWAHGHG